MRAHFQLQKANCVQIQNFKQINSTSPNKQTVNKPTAWLIIALHRRFVKGWVQGRAIGSLITRISQCQGHREFPFGNSREFAVREFPGIRRSQNSPGNSREFLWIDIFALANTVIQGVLLRIKATGTGLVGAPGFSWDRPRKSSDSFQAHLAATR